MFSETALRKGLRTRTFGNKIYTFESIDSTNSCAKAVAACGALEGTIVVAEEQTAGRGRLGRVWKSNANENLMFSIVLRPNIDPESINLLPLYVAVALSEGIEHLTGMKAECKWPNDLLINKKKVCGILIEASIRQNTVEHVVIGIGLNVNQTRFDESLRAKATSLKLEVGSDIDRNELFREIVACLETEYLQIASHGIHTVLPHWLSRTSMINKMISVSQKGSVFTGVVKGLSNDGGLVVQTSGIEKTLFSGDVTILGM